MELVMILLLASCDRVLMVPRNDGFAFSPILHPKLHRSRFDPMTQKNTKLELTWVGKENRPQLEPRILLHDPERSYHAAHRVSKDDLFDNKLIFGDNLLALKALEQEYTGKVKCI